jgi:hypothetical protein
VSVRRRWTTLCAAATLAAATLAAAACGDGTGPVAFPRRFDLVEYQGWPVPAVLQVITVIPAAPGAPGTTCEELLTAISLEFGGGHYVATRRTSIVCDDGRPATAGTSSEEGAYTVSGDSVTMSASDTFPNGVSTHRWFATRAANEVRVYRQETMASFIEILIDTRPLVFREAR